MSKPNCLLDETTHETRLEAWLLGGNHAVCDEILKFYKDTYKDLEPNEQAIARLAIVVEHFGGGVKIVKYSEREDRSTVYDIKISDKHLAKPVYRPVKCE